jgi:hypothetical protein
MFIAKWKKTIDLLGVVNDVADGAIKLITDLGKDPLSRDEDEIQRVVQLVEHNQKKIPYQTFRIHL